MSFYEFLQSFVGDDTPLGKLADYVEQDVNFPKKKPYRNIYWSTLTSNL
ncbi:YozE family protein [Staphylococcus pettenkoferi]